MFHKLGLLSKFECLLWPTKSFIAQPATIVLQNFANITVFLQNRTTNVRRVAQFRDYHRVSGKIVENVMLWLQNLASEMLLSLQKLPMCTLYLDLVFCFTTLIRLPWKIVNNVQNLSVALFLNNIVFLIPVLKTW